MATRAAGIGAHPPIEGERVLEGVEFAFGKRRYAARKVARVADFRGSKLRRHRHDDQTLSGKGAKRERAARLILALFQPILKRSKMVLMPLMAISAACSGVMFFCVMLASACGQSCSDRTAA